jgi:hypothetical protein
MFGIFPCIRCHKKFHLKGWPLPGLHSHSTVFVRCPQCKTQLRFFAWQIHTIPTGHPAQPAADNFRIGAVEKSPANYVCDLTLLGELFRRKNLERYNPT